MNWKMATAATSPERAPMEGMAVPITNARPQYPMTRKLQSHRPLGDIMGGPLRRSSMMVV